MIQKVEDVEGPLKKGDLYLVPCLIKGQDEDGVLLITPIINHPHNDIENGQMHVHYHVDSRFVQKLKRTKKISIVVDHSRLQGGNLEYFILPMARDEFSGVTPTALISKSKLKHNCIYKGKCPHRGYKLSQVAPRNGKITCPLHGLEFDEQTGLILNFL